MKILTRCHATRLQTYMATLTPPAQTGFIKGRSITENLLVLQVAMHYAKTNNIPAILLSLYFAKAYDRVQWTYLLKVLTALRFGPRFTQFITKLYTDREAMLNINGHLTSPFHIERGVLQGDPLSPLLFTL